jgi:hypothetical protein
MAAMLMLISDQTGRIARSSKAVGDKNLISLLKFGEEETVKHVVETDIR